jgi:uncharacterized membrane protein (UPF0127 family)
MKHLSKTAAAVILSLVALACTGNKAASGEEGPTGPNPRLATAELSVGGVTIQAELARTSAERERGLMFRTSLKEGEGMLFVFEADQRLAFWMKNTAIPLSLAYLSSDGTIREILDLEPHSLDIRNSERSVRYALEVPRGWFGKAGIRVGDRVAIPPLD